MLKGVRSGSLERSLQAIANASWDLTYISHWLQRARNDQARAIWLFCTHDRTCAALARCGLGPAENIPSLFEANYRDSDAQSLYSEYREVSAPSANLDRPMTLAARFQTLDALQQSLEDELAAAISKGLAFD
jgi:hypothetical protein